MRVNSSYTADTIILQGVGERGRGVATLRIRTWLRPGFLRLGPDDGSRGVVPGWHGRLPGVTLGTAISCQGIPMNGVTILLSVGILLLVLLGVVGYLLVVASARANQTEARVRALLAQADKS